MEPHSTNKTKTPSKTDNVTPCVFCRPLQMRPHHTIPQWQERQTTWIIPGPRLAAMKMPHRYRIGPSWPGPCGFWSTDTIAHMRKWVIGIFWLILSIHLSWLVEFASDLVLLMLEFPFWADWGGLGYLCYEGRIVCDGSVLSILLKLKEMDKAAACGFDWILWL
jgi:hypothetical protein